MRKSIITFLKKIVDKKPTDRFHNVELLTDREIDFIGEVCKNFLKENIPIGREVLRLLRPVRREIVILSSRKYKRKLKKSILKSLKGLQILNILIPPALKTLLSLRR